MYGDFKFVIIGERSLKNSQFEFRNECTFFLEIHFFYNYTYRRCHLLIPSDNANHKKHYNIIYYIVHTYYRLKKHIVM
jgi:hypothetical protein